MQAASQNRRGFPAFTGHFGKDRRIGCRGHRTSRQPRNFVGLRTQVAKALRPLLAGDKWRERKPWARVTHPASDNSGLDAAQPGEASRCGQKQFGLEERGKGRLNVSTARTKNYETENAHWPCNRHDVCLRMAKVGQRIILVCQKSSG